LIRLIKFIKKNKLRTVKIGIILITLALAIIHFWPEEDFTGKAVPFFPSNDYPLIFFDDSIDKIMRLAEKGNVYAQTALGTKYSVGTGVERNGNEALRWTKAAAEQGYAFAMEMLGAFLLAGKLGIELGIKQDYVQAYKWLLLADKYENIDTASARKRIGQKMTRAEIAEAKKLARDWQAKNWGSVKKYPANP
jgi:TPR repeat protein